MEHEFKAIFDRFLSISTCFVLSVVYVSSLYVWNAQYDRNHPSTIKKRFISVFIMMFVSPVFLYVAINEKVLEKASLWEIMGFKTQGLFQAFLVPWFLTMILFLGPLFMQLISGILKVYFEPMYWIINMQNLIWLRNHVVAPLSEEFTFRSCMLPLLLQSFSPATAIFICPLFFGVGLVCVTIPRILIFNTRNLIMVYTSGSQLGPYCPLVIQAFMVGGRGFVPMLKLLFVITDSVTMTKIEPDIKYFVSQPQASN